MRLKLSDMSPALLARVQDALAKQRPENGCQKPDAGNRARTAQDAPEPPALAGTTPKARERKDGGSTRGVRGPNKTEAAYNRLHLGGSGLYEAVTLRLPGGSRYTPDWVKFSVCPDSGIPVIELHEVKGSYRFGSQGRALTAFREAVAAFPCFTFVWAKRGKDGQWDIKRYGGSQHA